MAALRLDKTIEYELRSIEGNNLCCDCNEKNPQWASVSLGIFMCLECSGRHRSLGVHISFVRSVAMDCWSDKQISMMRMGGNDKCNAFLQGYGIAKNTPIPQKYNSAPALLYKDRLLAIVEGREPPTELPRVAGTNNGATAATAGTDPLPGETEESYVNRQRQLQAEARERMKQKFGASNGLRSGTGGSMQGIGSDPNYRPNSGAESSGGLSADEIAAQLNTASQAALSFLSSAWETTAKTVQDAKITDQVATGWGSLVGGGSTGQQTSSSQATSTDSLSSGWSMLSTAALDIWSQASTAVAAVVEQPNDDELRFPRPPEEQFRFPRPPAEDESKFPRPPPYSDSTSMKTTHLSLQTKNMQIKFRTMVAAAAQHKNRGTISGMLTC